MIVGVIVGFGDVPKDYSGGADGSSNNHCRKALIEVWKGAVFQTAEVIPA